MKKILDLSPEELSDKIKETKSFASLIKAIKKNSNIENNINLLISDDFKNASILEKLYSIKFNYNNYPKCKICGKNAALNKSGGWKDYCNNNCGYIDRWNNIDQEYKKELFNKVSQKYNQKTEEEKNRIKEKRKNTLLKNYNIDHNFKLNKVKEKRKNTWLSNYGFDNPNKSSRIKNKIIKTNNKKYGYNSPILNSTIKNKVKNTLLKNYGVDHNSKSDKVKEKKRKTCNEKYGYDHFMQNIEVFERINKKIFQHKNIVLNGNNYKVQGYEKDAINYLITEFNIKESSFIISDSEIYKIFGSIIWKDFNNKKHRYFPDFYITENNTLYEIKSEFTFNESLKEGVLNAKINACKILGINIKVLVFNKNKKIVKTYEGN